MRAWDLDSNSAGLRDAMKELRQAWDETVQQWDDPVSNRFCELHLEPIGPAFKLALDAIGRMQQVVSQIQRECEQ